MNGRREGRQTEHLNRYMEEKVERKAKRRRKRLLIFGLLVSVVLFLFLFGVNTRLTDLTIVGNTCYTEDELISMIFKNDRDFNTFYKIGRAHV